MSHPPWRFHHLLKEILHNKYHNYGRSTISCWFQIISNISVCYDYEVAEHGWRKWLHTARTFQTILMEMLVNFQFLNLVSSSSGWYWVLADLANWMIWKQNMSVAYWWVTTAGCAPAIGTHPGRAAAVFFVAPISISLLSAVLYFSDVFLVAAISFSKRSFGQDLDWIPLYWLFWISFTWAVEEWRWQQQAVVQSPKLTNRPYQASMQDEESWLIATIYRSHLNQWEET